jgi:hypothetical protein
MSECRVRSTGDRKLELALRLPVSSEVEQHRAERHPQAVLLRRQLECSPERGRGLGEAARSRLKLRQISKIGSPRLCSAPALEKLHGFGGSAAFGQKSGTLERIFLRKKKHDGYEMEEAHRLKQIQPVESRI